MWHVVRKGVEGCPALNHLLRHLERTRHPFTVTLTVKLSSRAADAQIVTETIPALQKLKEQGLIRAIGISGLPLDIFSYVLDRCTAFFRAWTQSTGIAMLM